MCPAELQGQVRPRVSGSGAASSGESRASGRLGALGGERAGFLETIGPLLWPEPARLMFTRSGQGGTGDNGDGTVAMSQLMVLPSKTKPRLLVPSERRPAAAAIRRHIRSGPRSSRLAKRAMWLAMSTSAGPQLFRDRLSIEAPQDAPTISAYLQAAFGHELRISLQVTGARANRKPLLQLLTPEGEALGFAKIGIDPLTRELVRAERTALAQLTCMRLRTFAVPRVLHHGSPNGLEVLVLAPLPTRLRRREVAGVRLNAVIAEIAGATGLTREPIAESAHWSRLHGRLLSAPETPERRAMQRVLPTLRERDGETTLSYGCWHGDFSPWNMASAHRDLWVWDWERFEAGVPFGFDVLHHWLQRQVTTQRRDPAGAASELPKRADALLEPFGVPAREARLTAVLYLAELSVRYLRDRQEVAGARLGNPGWWLIPAINEELSR